MHERHSEKCDLNFQILNQKIDSTSKRVDNLETYNLEMVKLSTLLELQIESNKEQDKFLRQQSETLIKVNENLTSLNNISKVFEKRLKIVEVDLQQQKVDNIRENSINKVDNIKESSINVVDLVKNIVIGGLILYIFMKLGLS